MSFILFSLELAVCCNRCQKREKVSVGVYSWNDFAENRELLLETQRKSGWSLPWNPRKGAFGPMLCPKCAKGGEG